MSYEVRLSNRAEKQLIRLPKESYERILTALLALEKDPRPRGSRKLKGQSGYRLRVGDYRSIYEIDDAMRVVTIIRVGHRRDIYR